MGLGMRSEALAMGTQMLGHGPNVIAHSCPIEHQCRGWQLANINGFIEHHWLCRALQHRLQR
jgi:hypothetical protein